MSESYSPKVAIVIDITRSRGWMSFSLYLVSNNNPFFSSGGKSVGSLNWVVVIQYVSDLLVRYRYVGTYFHRRKITNLLSK